MYKTCKHLLGRVWAFERLKFGILGEKRLKPETFWHSWWALAWASSKWACKRASPIGSGYMSLERAPSEIQASEPRSYWKLVA